MESRREGAEGAAVGQDLDELQFLSGAALRLVEILPEEDIFQIVAEHLATLAPQTLVVTNSYDPGTESTIVRAVVGPPDMTGMIRDLHRAGSPRAGRALARAAQSAHPHPQQPLPPRAGRPLWRAGQARARTPDIVLCDIGGSPLPAQPRFRALSAGGPFHLPSSVRRALLAPASGPPTRSSDDLVILGGSAHVELATAIADQLGLALGPYEARHCPDGELQVAVGEDVRGRHAVLVQPTARPSGDHLLELLLMADACRRVGVRAVTAIVPYVGYARQDRRTQPSESRLLGLPVAIVYKTRLSPSEVKVDRIIGSVRGMRPILVDDMISTGGTIQAAAEALMTEGCTPEIIAVTTHSLLVAPAVQRLHAAGVSLLVSSDSLPSQKYLPFPHEIVSLAPVLAQAVRRACRNR